MAADAVDTAEAQKTDIVWDRAGLCVQHIAAEQPLLDAALRCFRQPGPPAVAALEALLHAEPVALLRQCVLIVQVANAVLDEEGVQLAAIFAEKGKPVVCRAGCVRCCHQLMLSRPYEARLIQAFLEAEPGVAQALAPAYAAWDRATAAYRQSYLRWAEGMYSRGEDDGSHTLEDFQEPCPFLTAGGQCAIYPVRPYACRTCIGLDPACPAPPQGQKDAVYVHYSLYTSHHAARQAVNGMLLRRLAVDSRSVSMPEMVAQLCGWG